MTKIPKKFRKRSTETNNFYLNKLEEMLIV